MNGEKGETKKKKKKNKIEEVEDHEVFIVLRAQILRFAICHPLLRKII